MGKVIELTTYLRVKYMTLCMYMYVWYFYTIGMLLRINSTCTFVCTYLSFAKVEFGIGAEATLEHLKWEDLILVQERTNAGSGHFFNVAMVNEINFNLQRERGEGERER